MFHTILVPYDGSALAQLALPYAEAMARASGAELVLVYALAPWESPLDVPRALYEAAAQGRRDGLAVRTTNVPPRLSTQGAAIVEYAQAIGADLVALSPWAPTPMAWPGAPSSAASPTTSCATPRCPCSVARTRA